MFTSGQVSEMLDVPSASLRRYVRQFSKHLSEGATRGRGRRFVSRDIEVIRRIRELYAQGRSLKEIDALLRVIDDQPDNEETTLALVPSISKELTRVLDVAQSLRAEVGDLNIKVENVAEAQNTTSEEVAQLREWLSLPWWKRLGKPSGINAFIDED